MSTNTEQKELDFTFNSEAVAEDVINELLGDASTVVNGKTKKPKFDKKTSQVSGLENVISVTATDGIFYALGSADVKAYYYNSNLDFTVASTVAAGTFINKGTDMDLTFARGASTTKIYAYGKDVTLFDTTAGDVFVGGYNKYDKKNVAAKLEKTEGNSEVIVMNSTVKNIYAGGEGDDIYEGDVVVKAYNSKIGKIYAGGKNGAYTQGDLTVIVSNDGNKNASGANMVFTGAVFGTPADKKSNSWGTTSVIVSDYKGAYKGAFNYVDKVTVAGDSDVTFSGAFKEVGTIAVAGGATAVVNKNGAYAYELILTSDTLSDSYTSMLTVGKAVKAIDKVVVTVNDDFANNGAVNLLSWAGYTPKKGAEVALPDFAVMNENGGYDGNGGIVADYMYSYSFDVKNNLIFNYSGEAYALSATWVDAEYVVSGNAIVQKPNTGVFVTEEKAFGAADDEVVLGANYDYSAVKVNLGAGANEIDLANANAAFGEFELTVNNTKAKNTVDAREFANAVTFADKGGKDTKAVAIVGNATGSVDFKGSKEATLIVDGNYAGVADFTSVKENATVVLENGAAMNIGQIQAGDKEVVIEVGAFNTATLTGFNAFDYILKEDVAVAGGNADVDFVDYQLDLGNNARLDVTGAGTDFVVNNYSKNILAKAAMTYTVLGAFSSDVMVDGAAFRLDNVGFVNGKIEAVNGGSLNFNNFGVFEGTFDGQYANAGDTITVKDLANTGLAPELNGVVILGGGDDKLTFDGDVKVSADIVKLNTSAMTVNVQNGTVAFDGAFIYTMQGDYTDNQVTADEEGVAVGVNNNTFNLTNATFTIGADSFVAIGTLNINNALINGEGDYSVNTINVLGGTVVFDRDIVQEGAFNVLNDADLTALNITAGSISTAATTKITAENLTATATDIAIHGIADVADVTAAKNVTFDGAGTLGNVIAQDGKVTIIAADDIAIATGDITAKAVADADGNFAAGEGDVAISAGADATVNAGAVVADKAVAITGAGEVTVTSIEAASINQDAIAGNLTVDTLKANEGNIRLNNVVVNGSDAVEFDVDAAGSVTFNTADVTGSVKAGADVIIGAGVVTENIVAGRNVNLTNTDAGNVTAGATVTATTDDREGMTLGDIAAAQVSLTATNAFNEGAYVYAGPDEDDQDADILNVGNITATAVADDPFTAADESIDGSVTLAGNGAINANVIDADGEFKSTVATLTADSIEAASVAITGAAYVEGKVEATAGAVTTNGVIAAESVKGTTVTLRGDVDIDGDVEATAGSVVINSTALGDVDGLVKATGGNVIMTAIANAELTTGDVDANAVDGVGGNVTLNGAGTINVDAVTADGAFNSTIANLNADSIEAASVAITGAAVVDGDVTATAGNLTIAGSADIEGDVAAAEGVVNVNGVLDAASVAGKTVLLYGDINVDGDVDATEGQVVISSFRADSVVGGDVTAATDVTLAANPADATLEVVGTIDAVNVTFQGAGAFNVADIEADGYVKAGDAATEANVIAGTIDAASFVFANGSIAADAVTGSAVTLKGAVDVEGKVEATAGNVQITSLKADSEVGEVVATADVILTANPADASLTAADVTAGANVTIQGAGTVNAGIVEADAAFNSTAANLNAASIEAASVAITGAAVVDGNVTATAGSVNTTGSLAAVDVTGDAVLLQGALDIDGDVTANVGQVVISSFRADSVVGGDVTAATDVTLAANPVDATLEVVGTIDAVNVTFQGAGAFNVADIEADGYVKAGDATTEANVTAGTINAAGFVFANGSIAADAVTGSAVTLKGAVDVEGKVEATAGDAKITAFKANSEVGDVFATADIVLTANPADVTLTAGKVDAGANVTIQGAGTVNAGIVEADAAFNSTAANLNATSIEAASVAITGAAVVDNDVTATAGSVNTTGSLEAFNVTGDAVLLQGALDIDGNVTANVGQVVISSFKADSVVDGDVTAATDVTLAANPVDATLEVVGIIDAVNVTFQGAGTVNAGIVEADAAFNSTAANLTADSIEAASVAITGAAVVAGTVVANDGTVSADGVLTAESVTGNAVILKGDINVAGEVKATDGQVVVTSHNAESTVGSVVAEAGNVTLAAVPSDAKITVLGDVTANAVYDPETNAYVSGGIVNLIGSGEIVINGMIFADYALNITVASLTFNGAVVAGELDITEGQTFTFNNANVEINKINVKDLDADSVATINVANNAVFKEFDFEDNAYLALNLNGNKVTAGTDDLGNDIAGTVALTNNSKIAINDGHFVGTITEEVGATGATVALKNALVDAVVFNGSNIEVTNAGTITDLTFNNTLNITGVSENTVAASLTVTNGIYNDVAGAQLAMAGNIKLNADVTVEKVSVAEGAYVNFAGDVTADADIAENASVGFKNFTGDINAGDAANITVAEALAGSVIGTAASLNITGSWTNEAADSLTAGTVNINNQTTDVEGNVTASNGALFISGSEYVVNGDLSVTDGDMAINGGKVAGNITMELTGNVDAENNIIRPVAKGFAELADGYTGTIKATAAADTSISLNIGGSVIDATFDITDGVTVTAGSVVDWNEEKTEISGKTIATNGSFIFNGDYVGGFNGAMNVTVNGDYFGGFAADQITAGTVKVKNFTVTDVVGGQAQDAITKHFEALAATFNETHTVTQGVVNTVADKYNDGLVYAYITATGGDVSIDKLFVGRVNATADTEGNGGNITFGKDATAALDTVVERASGSEMTAAWAKNPALKTFVTGAESVVAEGNVYGNVDYYVNKDFEPEHADIARDKIFIVNGAVINNVKDVNIAGDFFGNITASGDVVLGGDIARGMKDWTGTWPSTPAPDAPVYATATIKAGTFENTNDAALIYANITADAADAVDAETGAITKVALKTVATVNGNVTATAGSVDVASVTGNVKAQQNATVNGTVGGNVTATEGDATVTGAVVGYVTAGQDATINGNVGGYVTAAGTATLVDGQIIGDVTAAMVNIGSNGIVGDLIPDPDPSLPPTIIASDVTATGNDIEADAEAGIEFTAAAVIDGLVYGDVTAANGTAMINGTVGGNVEANNVRGGSETAKASIDGSVLAYENVEIYAAIGGNVSAGADATVYGSVVGDVTAAGAATVIGTGDVVNNIEGASVTVTGNVKGNAYATAGDAVINGNVGGLVEAENVTVTGTALEVVAYDTATLGGNITNNVTAETVVKGEGATITEIGGTVTANEIALEGVKVGAVVAGDDINEIGAGDVTVGDVVYGISYYGNDKAGGTITGGTITGSLVINNDQDFEDHPHARKAIVANFNEINANMVFTTKDHTYELGELGTVHDDTVIEVNAENISGTLTFTAGPNAGGKVTLTAEDTIAVNAIDATTTAVDFRANADTVDVTGGISLNAGDFINAATVKADQITLAVDTEGVANLSTYFSPEYDGKGITFEVNQIVADTLGIDFALDLDASLKVSGNLNVTAEVTGSAITLTKADAVFNGSEAVKEIIFEANGTVAQINGGKVSGTDDANAITFEAATDATMIAGDVDLALGNDILTFESATSCGTLDGGDDVDTLNINAAVGASGVTDFESVVFGAAGSLAIDATSTGADFDFDKVAIEFAAKGTNGSAVITGATLSNLVDGTDFVTVGGANWTWNDTEKAFVSGTDKLVYNEEDKTLTWNIA